MISVLICTRNRADSLRRTLDSLFCPPSMRLPGWEAVVVDNNSNDHTGQVCRQFAERFPGRFRFLVERKPGKSNALNLAITEAQGDILAFTDDDVLCCPDYIQSIHDIFREYPADGVQGRILLDCEGGHPDWLDPYMGLTVGWRDCGDDVKELDGTLCGSNMVVRADAIRKLGGFLPELGPGRIGLGEETELSLRMRQAGCRLLYAPRVLVWHCLPRKRLTKAHFRKRFFQQGRASAYYTLLPVSVFRFTLYLAKELVLKEIHAIWHLLRAQPAAALHCQCDVYSQAGFLWQHWLFKHKTPHKALHTAPPRAWKPDCEEYRSGRPNSVRTG